jgi:subfamily B ATP-binding cassette protein MsbA
LDLLPVGVLLLVGVKGATLLAGPLQRYYFSHFEEDVLVDLQSHLLAHTLRLPKSFFDEQQTGYLVSRLTADVQGLRWFFSGTLVYLASSGLRFIGGLVLVFFLEWRLTLMILVLLPVVVVVVRFFSVRLRALSLQGMEQRGSIARRVQEALSSSSLIKSFSTEEREQKKVEEELNSARQLALEQTTVSGLAGLIIDSLPDVASALTLILGAVWIIAGEWTLGSLLAFQSYQGYVFGPAMGLASASLQLQNALAALERVSAVYDIVPEETGAGLQVEHLGGQVEFDQVSFSYNGHDPILQNISFLVQPGEQIAIVGPSGVGKTTLVSLLLRFYRPTAGEIRLDGRPAQEYQLAALRRRIGYVSQSPTLLSGTLLENLAYADPTVAFREVEQAARAAGIHDFIAGLPEGYQSVVGERGVNFSEGQKQRLSIARALVKRPDILVLDEPTAALDSITERSIFEALPEVTRGRTLFVIAHRLATVQKADRILVLNEGALEACGTHQELLLSSSLYRTLAANQDVLAVK